MTPRVVILLFSLANICLANNNNLKIIGGHDVDIKQYPYQLSLQWRGGHTCGAVLIAENWALTTAQCADSGSEGYFDIRAGITKIHEGGQVVKIKKVHAHPRYSFKTLSYDISVLELDKVNLNDAVRPIKLPEAGTDVSPGARGVITGYGVKEEFGGFAPQLQAVDTIVIGRQDCSDAYKNVNNGAYQITNEMICTKDVSQKVGGCTGDYGGPLVVDGKLVGLISWGYGCDKSFPSVYTNIGAVRDFIKQISGI